MRSPTSPRSRPEECDFFYPPTSTLATRIARLFSCFPPLRSAYARRRRMRARAMWAYFEIVFSRNNDTLSVHMDEESFYERGRVSLLHECETHAPTLDDHARMNQLERELEHARANVHACEQYKLKLSRVCSQLMAERE